MIYFGDIVPEGWARQELQQNMAGCIGKLDQLVPDLLRDHDIYHTDRLGKHSQLRDLGRNDSAEEDHEDIQEQFFWWNSESQSNWRDGFLRSAMMLGDPEYLEQVKQYLKKIASSSDEGYLGIYSRDLRFACTGENGELWAQSTLYRGLLACYEYSKDPEILDLIIRAVDVLMKGYPMGESHPFDLERPFSGAGHGLTITDALYRLYQLTGDEKYQTYAAWLYGEYSAYEQAENDLQEKNVMNRDYFFQGHGVHTYEHIRPLAVAAHAEKRYVPVLDRALDKLPYYIAPSGGPIGDEWIYGRCADATNTAYEFCSIHELLHTYSLLLEMSGDFSWADKAEWLYWNAAEGMMHPEESTIMYLKADNCYTADEKCHPGDTIRNARYKYSPTHRDVAVCCVPNFGRILPYFIQASVMETEKGFAVPLYNPVCFTGRYENQTVHLRMKTDFPREMSAQLSVTTSEPLSFDIVLRFPHWASAVKVDGQVHRREDVPDQKLVLNRKWFRDTVSISFECSVELRKDFRGDGYITRGPLVYCLELPGQEKIVREYPVEGFVERAYRGEDPGAENKKLVLDAADSLHYTCLNEGALWSDHRIMVTIDGPEGLEKCTLRPMARTILRKVTFPVIHK